MVRYLGAIVILSAIVGFGWVFSLPSKAECVASGRTVDPTERHCESSAGYQQLQEHALFHSRDVVFGATVLFAVGYAAYLYRRRRPSDPERTT